MSKPSDTRLTSEVRSVQQRAEPLGAAPRTPAPLALTPAPPSARPFGQSRPRTTRFRLERVSLLPFVPAPLLAYVERARTRRRTRLVGGALIVLAAAACAVAGVMLRRGSSADTETQVRTAVPATPLPRPAQTEQHALASPPPPAPAAVESETPARRSNALATKRSRATRKPNDDVHRSTRERPAPASSAWWW